MDPEALKARHLALKFKILAFPCMKHTAREFQHAIHIYLWLVD